MPVNPGSMYYNDGGIVGCPIAYCVTDETTPFYTDGEGISYYGGVVIVLPNLVYHNQMATFHPDFYVTITPTNEQIETDIANSGNNSISYSVMDGNLVFDFYPPANWGYYYVPKSPSINSKRYVINGTEYNQNVVKVFKVSGFDSGLTRPTVFEFVGSCEEPLYGAGINYNTLIFNRNVASNDDQDTSTLICYCHFLANGLAYAKNGTETQRTNVITDPVVKLNGSLVNETDMVVLPKRVALIEVLAQNTEVGFGARWGLLDETPFKGGKLITVLKDGNTLEDYNTNGNSVVDYQLYTENGDLTSMALEDCFVKLDDTHTDTFDNDPTYSGTYDPTIHNLPFFSPIGKLYINSELNENYLNTYQEPYVAGFEGNTYIYLDPVLYADYSKEDTVYNSSDVLVAIIEERIPANPTYPSTGTGDPGFVYVYEPAGNYDLLANYTGGVIFSVLKKGKTQQNYDPATDIISKFILVKPTYSGDTSRLYPLWSEADFIADTTRYNIGSVLTGPQWIDRLERKYGYSSVDNSMEVDPSFEPAEDTALRITNYNSLLSDVYTPLSFEDPNNETITVAFEEKKNESGNEGDDPTLISRFDDPLAYPVYGSPGKAIISTALLQELSNAMKSRYGVPDPLSVSDMINLIKYDSPVTEL